MGPKGPLRDPSETLWEGPTSARQTIWGFREGLRRLSSENLFEGHRPIWAQKESSRRLLRGPFRPGGQERVSLLGQKERLRRLSLEGIFEGHWTIKGQKGLS